ncbi:MAG: hypothetical protein ACM3O3_12890 [Syntrophothermus sp.]
MKINEILRDLKDKILYIPDEIFNDLSMLKYKSNKHYGFTVCLYILINYLYYTCYYNNRLISNQDIKEILGYNRKEKRIDYIIKQNGLLDSSGYTKMVYDIPVSVDELLNINNYSIKYPVKSFYRNLYDSEITGTYYYHDNTIKISSKTFFDIINNIDVTGYLIYLYIKKYNPLIIGYVKLSEVLKISKQNLIDKIKILELFGYISIEVHKSYPDNDKSNIYRILK